MTCTTLFAPLLFLAASGQPPPSVEIPPQFFYEASTASSLNEYQEGGCRVSTWEGTDPNGYFGYPFVTKIECLGKDDEYSTAGVNVEGMLQFFLVNGSVVVNEQKLSVMGSSYWANQGSAVSLSLKGPHAQVTVVGSRFRLCPSCEPFKVGTSFLARTERAYLVEDAARGTHAEPYNNASVGHDEHICNGTTTARDLAWASQTGVDPPAIVVLNCHGETGSYVWYHTHPQGALYLAFIGSICFQQNGTRCIEQGDARWTSPNLYYYETFEGTHLATPQARELIRLAWNGNESVVESCTHPILFSVTNFDPTNTYGQPNFDDVPPDFGSELASGLRKDYGVFDTIQVRAIQFASVASRVVDPAKEQEQSIKEEL